MLQPLLAPRSVAVVGASDDPDKVGGRPIDYLRRFGFAGSVYPVNPNRAVVQGLVSYPDIASIPEPPDAVVIVVPGDGAVTAVEQCAAAGVGAAVVLASGFAETSSQGRQAQDRMAAVARQAGMRLMGPNCQGATNFSNGAVLTFSTAYLEQPPADGPIAVVSQSGSMSQVPYALLRSRGLGVRYCVATGNEADVSASEVAAAVSLDPAVELVLLYLETIRDVTWLVELGRTAAERHLPVIALKAGSTAAGQAAAQSHTAALANEDRVVEAFLERIGVYRAKDLPDLLSAVDLHLRRDWKPTGKRVVVVSNSGASCVQAADAIVNRGLEVAQLADETVGRISSVLPAFATTRNPVDLTGALLGNSHFLPDVLSVLAADPALDSLIVAVPVLGQGYDVEAIASAIADFSASGQAAVAVTLHAATAALLRDRKVPVFVTEAEAVAALDQWLACHHRRSAAATRPLTERSGRPSPGRLETLDEMSSMAVVGEVGVPVVEHELCHDVEAALAAFHRFGGRVVVKGCTARVTHKSDVGLVAVDLRTDDDVRLAYEQVAAALRSVDPDAAGVLVAPMVRARRELMIGGRVDLVFGPVVVVGDGGAYVEAVPDLGVMLVPFDPDDVRQTLHRLRIGPLLQGVRGEAAIDVEAVARAAVAVSRLLTEDSGVVEVDVNPVLAGSVGEGCIAVDAVVRLDQDRHPIESVPEQ